MVEYYPLYRNKIQFELTAKTELASLLEEFKLTNKNFLNDTDEFKENLLKSYS